jgi:PAS domain S-box-containing protein
LTGAIHWSDAVYNIFEVDPASFELTFDNLLGKFHPDDRSLLLSDFEVLLGEKAYYESEHRILSRTGAPKWVYERIRLVRDANGKAMRIEGVILDVDKHKKAELDIQRKNQLLNATQAFVSKLLKHNDWITAIKESFNIIGDTVSVERIYYFENHTDLVTGEALTSQRISWINDGTVVLDDPASQNMPFSIFGSFQTLSTGKPFHGIVSQLPEGMLKTTLAAQHIKSLLALPVFVNNVFHGFIGFDDTKNERSWQEDEVSFLDTLAFNLATAIEKRKVEYEVRESREQFQSVINNLPGITYRCLPDKDWTMTFLSDEVERMIGYTAAEFIDNKTRSFASIIHPDDLPVTYSILKKIKRKEPFELEYRMVCKNGHIVWVKENGRGIFDDNDNLIYIDGVIIDITTSKQQQEALRDSNERFELVLKATGEAIVDWDIEKDIAIWGDGFRQLFGYDLDIYDNHLWSRNIHPHDKERVMAKLQETIQDPAQFFFFAEFRYLKANGDIAHVQHRGIFVRDASGKAIRAIGSMTDVTNLVEHTRKVEEQNDVLREIAWTQSHVVRAPLASLMGLLELMKNRECMNLDEKELLEKLDVAADELDTVIHKIVQTTEQIL